MAGWSCADRNLIEWDGDIRANNFFVKGTNLITGSGSSGRVSYFSAATTLTSSSTFTFSSSPVQLKLNSAASPQSSQLFVQAATTGGVSILAYAADNNAIGFDTDWSGGNWYARDTSAFSISKDTDLLKIRGNASLTSGNIYSPTTLLTLTTDGKLGLNISPAYTFHAKSTTDTVGLIESNYSTSDGSFLAFKNYDGDFMTIGNHGFSSTPSQAAFVVYNNSATPGKVKMYGSDGTGSNLFVGKMRIDNSYQYAYTTSTDPTYALEVLGEIQSTDDITTTAGDINCTAGVYSCQSASGISTSFIVPSGYNSAYYDSDGDGTNDTWGYVITGIQTVTVTGGIITSIV
jgi:hypothetical protein